MAINGAPFDEKRKVVPHVKGKVKDGESVVDGLYVAGWAKRGPVGIIDATLRDARETFATILSDIEAGLLQPKNGSCEFPSDTVSFSKWELINDHELAEGKQLNKLREKIRSRDEMLKIIES